ncbi:GNAT family N-acetyltransferase [Massilia sp. erpn]|uniref:GNAT family N-acetyltransferase n=1 Tax=Massilia sp. erpn TaxID=2738142 RepID=UPI0021079EB2|nr:GNAT family N-acetyltransferase [Massilia sp. erpn]UTY58101.1 GNAT family N-acetyltransferase [Massilia sp. erpn]
MNDIQIRPATPADSESIWTIFQELIASGDTYYFAADTSREDCHDFWFGPGVQTWAATRSSGLDGEERLLGMYRILPNQRDRGGHVATASLMVSPAAQGVGIGKLLGRHCLEQASASGFLSMQFNYVVSTNVSAVLLWKRLGFAVIGTLPKAYRHQQLGFVDVYVMYKFLSDPNGWPEQ